MLDQLTQLTNSDEYIQRMNLFITEVVIRPKEEMRITLEIFDDFSKNVEKDKQVWEIICKDIIYSTSNKIHEPKRPYNRINVYTDHPVLLNYVSSVYFSITGTCDNIAELMGDLFIAHDKTCGDWVDFHWLFSSLPETLRTLRSNQLSLPEKLFPIYAEVFKKHNLQFTINEVDKQENDLTVLIFGNPDVAPDNYCFGQPYVVAGSFEERLKTVNRTTN